MKKCDNMKENIGINVDCQYVMRKGRFIYQITHIKSRIYKAFSFNPLI